ncbi:MAG TPA: hypothetical protein DD405_03275 [Desulfobacteraceae bacterium]|nr:hypothetical protein [Desulfobacteraceae bacterium]
MTNHKRLLGIIVLAVFLLSGCYKSECQKIREKHAAGMYQETIKKLEQIIDKNPNNSEAHFLLATAYLNIDNFNSSERRFRSALKLQKNEKSRAEIKQKIGQEYKNTFFSSLEIVQSDSQYLFNKMRKFSNPDTIAHAENHLRIFCNKRMNKRNYSQARNGYKYLAKLKPSLKKEIGQKYLILFNKVEDQKLKTRVIEDALDFCQEDFITKAYAEYHYGLSKQAETTAESIAKLKNANRFGNLYSSELQVKQAQFKQEQFLVIVKKCTSQLGPAKKITLNKLGEWKPACTIKNKSIICYLSLNRFKKRDNVNKENTWRA